MSAAAATSGVEHAYCANCRKVQPLEDYDIWALAKSDGVKQCVVCHHIVDSTRSDSTRSEESTI